jgi:hypothetical protein
MPDGVQHERVTALYECYLFASWDMGSCSNGASSPGWRSWHDKHLADGTHAYNKLQGHGHGGAVESW